MKNECDIVMDLLFSYSDGVLSDTSKEFVEKHLKTCKNCNKILKDINKEDEKIEEKEIDAFKGIKKKINRKNIFICISLFFLLGIIIFNIMIFINYNKFASEMQIFLEDNITEEQLNNIENAIKNSTESVEIKYISKEKELEEVKKWSKSELIGIDTENNPMLASIKIEADKKDIQEITNLVQNIPGIRKISTNLSMNPYELFIGQYLIK